MIARTSDRRKDALHQAFVHRMEGVSQYSCRKILIEFNVLGDEEISE